MTLSQLNREERHQDYLEQQAERRQSLIDDIAFDQRYGGADWIADLDLENAHDALVQIWSALNGQQRGTADSADEAIDDARDAAMPYIDNYAIVEDTDAGMPYINNYLEVEYD